MKKKLYDNIKIVFISAHVNLDLSSKLKSVQLIIIRNKSFININRMLLQKTYG